MDSTIRTWSLRPELAELKPVFENAERFNSTPNSIFIQFPWNRCKFAAFLWYKSTYEGLKCYCRIYYTGSPGHDRIGPCYRYTAAIATNQDNFKHVPESLDLLTTNAGIEYCRAISIFDLDCASHLTPHHRFRISSMIPVDVSLLK